METRSPTSPTDRQHLNVCIRLFARARDLAGTDTVTLDLAPPATVGALKTQLAQKLPALRPLVPHLLVAVNGNYTQDDDPLSVPCEVACFPPVSGG